MSYLPHSLDRKKSSSSDVAAKPSASAVTMRANKMRAIKKGWKRGARSVESQLQKRIK